MKNSVYLLGLIMLMFCTSVQAQKVIRPRGGAVGSWRVLGTTHAGHSADHDVIVVSGPYDYFRKLNLK